VTAALIIAGAVAAGLLVAGLLIHYAPSGWQDEARGWREGTPPRGWHPPPGSN
jgi:hypothetical protein